ncbi:MAG: UbiA family prenyltransferase [Planctomycetota bacterium]
MPTAIDESAGLAHAVDDMFCAFLASSPLVAAGSQVESAPDLTSVPTPSRTRWKRLGDLTFASSSPSWSWPMAALIRSRLWVALHVMLLGLVAPAVLGFDLDLRALAVLFGSTLAIYSVDDLFEARAAGRVGGLRGVAAAIGTGITGYALVESPSATIALVAVGGLACFGYGAPLPGIGRPKDIPGIKAAWVAGAVTVAAVFVPWTFHPAADVPPGDAWGLFAVLGVITFANVVGFDVRDLAVDRERGVPTLPSLLGVRRVRKLLFALHGLVLIALVALRGAGLAYPVPFFAVALFASALVVRGLVTEASVRKRLIHDVLGDGFLGLLGVTAWWLAR